MCLILFAWKQHADYPLVVAANRDEFYARDSAPAHWWPDKPGILAGRDLRAGGTWMGITAAGRFAALTNYRDPARHRDDAQSRGDIVTAVLEASDPLAYLQTLLAARQRFNPFNLLLAEGDSLWCLESVSGRLQRLEAGVYGLSNAFLDTPWPKVERGKRQLSAQLGALPETEGLFDLLSDDTIAPDADLPQTGVPLEWERLLSAALIRAPGYGTRSQTVVLCPPAGTPELVERVLR
ncbi:NRDE family protein [Niveibacterium sp. 24ML]|uniref:NRDE family protein n=1 Tax=Niveibacterium sp. 24ML TaxID=2985512 RepID=UPI0022703442|nr:NRDE family protein [Niveibacterium sp. 24ML]MCX9156728.1 NRDE family protein [Niveibacterium sp. 24ML]